MKAYAIGRQDGLHALTLIDRADPAPGPGEVVLAVRMAGLNHRDLLLVSGTYAARQPDDRTPLSEGIGEVAAIGEDVTTFEVGDRAICPHFVTWLGGAFSPTVFAHDIGITLDGWLAERVRIPAAALVRVPDSVSDEQAAPLASSALTAWNALVEVGKVKAGDIVLALGTGSVSIAALQIAKLHGAQVIVTSSSDEKLERARALGADATINYRTDPDWAAEVMRATDGAGADIIVETGGQATLSQSIAAAAANGRIAVIGALAGAASEALPNFRTIIRNNLVLHGITEGSRAMLEALLRAVEINCLKPVIAETFCFEDAAAAYERLHAGRSFGKVMIKIA